MDLYAEVENLLGVAQGLLSKAANEGKYSPAVEAVGKITRLLELVGRLQGDLDTAGTTVNIIHLPEVKQFVTVLLTELEPFPDARVVVAKRMAELQASDTADV